MAVPIFTHINTMSRARMRRANRSRSSREVTPLDPELEKRIKENEKVLNDKLSVAGNPNSSIEELRKLISDSNEKVVLRVLKNPKCDESILRIASNHANSSVRLEVARNDKCPLDILNKFLGDKDSFVKRIATMNPNFPFDKMIELARTDRDIYKNLFLVAENPDTTYDQFLKLIEFDVDVCGEVIRNKNCPVVILETLLNHKDRFIRSEAKNALIIKASNPSTSKEELEELSKIKILGVQLEVANNPNCPNEVFINLMNRPMSFFFNVDAKKRARELKNVSSKFKTIKREELTEENKEILENKEIEEDNFTFKM